jgi:hypothetical protein
MVGRKRSLKIVKWATGSDEVPLSKFAVSYEKGAVRFKTIKKGERW